METTQQSGLTCPECDHAHCFSLETTAYGRRGLCHRASCGYVLHDFTVPGPRIEPRRVSRPVYTGVTRPLYSDEIAWLDSKIGIDPYTAESFIQGGDVGRVVMPIYGPRHELRGAVDRRAWDGWPGTVNNSIVNVYRNNDKRPKALTYREPGYDGPLLAHYPVSSPGNCIVVEDQLSAIKIMSVLGTYAIALLGTHMSVAAARELCRHERIILALDEDATDTAFEIARTYGSAFRSLRVAMLDCDLKYVPPGELAGKLGL